MADKAHSPLLTTALIPRSHPLSIPQSYLCSITLTENCISQNSETVGSNSRTSNHVHRGTCTNSVASRTRRCKYCQCRLRKLQQLENLKVSKASSSQSLLSSSIPSSTSFPGRRDVECQTPAGLFEQAQMSSKEIRSLMEVLRHRSSRPLRTETFCNCVIMGREDCRCGESDKCFDWLWDPLNKGKATVIQEEGRGVMFHRDYSCGTSAVRGSLPMEWDQHFWEIKMTTPVYGTDIMVGIGTSTIDLNENHNAFCSMLGDEDNSWGISYDGRVQHDGKKSNYSSCFGQGAIIGVHLDMWHGTLTFYKNRQSFGVAFRGLRGRSLYPMACSTAARSCMRIVSSRSFPSSLQFLCCQKLRRLVPPHLNVLDVIPVPPGLRFFLAHNLSWLLRAPPTSPTRKLIQEKNAGRSNYVCNVCLPVRNVFEGHTDDEEGSGEEEQLEKCVTFLESYSDDSDGSVEEESVTSVKPGWCPPARGYTTQLTQPNWQPAQGARVSHSTPHFNPSRQDPSVPSGLKRRRIDFSAGTSTDEVNVTGESKDKGSDREEDAQPQGFGDSGEHCQHSCHLIKRKRSHK